MTLYYTIETNGLECNTGTSGRGFIHKYKTLETAYRYFFQWAIRGMAHLPCNSTLNVYHVAEDDRYTDTAYRLIAKYPI